MTTYNYKRDAKKSRPSSDYKPKKYDACQTPPYAIEPLVKYLNDKWLIWECASGEGYISNTLEYQGFNVTESDILTGENFFEYQPKQWDCIVTNPPFSLKYKWLKRCYDLKKPFALLLPVETLGAQTGQKLFKLYGLEVILLDKRVDFKMPNKGWSGGGAQFATAWFTYGLDIGKQISYEILNKNHQKCDSSNNIG